MAVLSRSVYVLAIVDALIIGFITFLNFYSVTYSSIGAMTVTTIFVLVNMLILMLKGFYTVRQYTFKDIYLLFEGIFIATFLSGLFLIRGWNTFVLSILLTNLLFTFAGILIARIIFVIYKNNCNICSLYDCLYCFCSFV